jgi:RNA polymerase sigma-70 factor (ECF subfamily)
LDLLERARQGDELALDELMQRYGPRLRRWARGRLPAWARSVADTQDMVQDTLLRTLRRIESFEVRGEGALQAYLRQALLNRIREEMRRTGCRPSGDALDSEWPDDAPTPLELAVGQETLRRYDAALARLRLEDRQAIIGRVELAMNNDELARALGKPTANAARVALQRALLRLAEEMRR